MSLEKLRQLPAYCTKATPEQVVADAKGEKVKALRKAAAAFQPKQYWKDIQIDFKLFRHGRLFGNILFSDLHLVDLLDRDLLHGIEAACLSAVNEQIERLTKQ